METIKTQEELFALNDEQKALMEEWKILKEKMGKANMIMLLDENCVSLAVINGEKIAEIHTDDEYYEENCYEYLDECAVEWGNFELPKLTTYYSGLDLPFFMFNDGVEKYNTTKSMESAAL